MAQGPTSAARRGPGNLDGAGVGQLGNDLWPVIVLGAVLIPFSLCAFGRAERHAKQAGKRKRVG